MNKQDWEKRKSWCRKKNRKFWVLWNVKITWGYFIKYRLWHSTSKIHSVRGPETGRFWFQVFISHTLSDIREYNLVHRTTQCSISQKSWLSSLLLRSFLLFRRYPFIDLTDQYPNYSMKNFVEYTRFYILSAYVFLYNGVLSWQ